MGTFFDFCSFGIEFAKVQPFWCREKRILSNWDIVPIAAFSNLAGQGIELSLVCLLY